MTVIDVVLVDQDDRPIGKMEKLEAHRTGRLHRAISVYVFNHQQQLLLQRRASNKYHCGGLWSNTCCGHPCPGESAGDAAARRLREEMGMRPALTPIFELSYRLSLNNGLTEHEYGHVFFAITNQQPDLNRQEADAWRYVALDDLQQQITDSPAMFTPWFVHTFPRIPVYLQQFMAQAAEKYTPPA